MTNESVSILVFVDHFCNKNRNERSESKNLVSILVFVDHFCNYEITPEIGRGIQRFNPCFRRPLLQLLGDVKETNKTLKKCFNPCFRRPLLQPQTRCPYSRVGIVVSILVFVDHFCNTEKFSFFSLFRYALHPI